VLGELFAESFDLGSLGHVDVFAPARPPKKRGRSAPAGKGTPKKKGKGK
jgi:hypothetical protein